MTVILGIYCEIVTRQMPRYLIDAVRQQAN